MNSLEDFMTMDMSPAQKERWLDRERRFSHTARIFRSEWDLGVYLLKACFHIYERSTENFVTGDLRDGFEASSMTDVLETSLNHSHCYSCWKQDYSKDPRKWWRSHPEVYSDGKFTVALWGNGWMRVVERSTGAYVLLWGGSLERSSYYDAVDALPEEERKRRKEEQREKDRRERHLRDILKGNGR